MVVPTPALPVRITASADATLRPAATLAAATAAAVDALTDSIADRKPKLRGWLHAGLAPLAAAGGVVATILAPDGAATMATAAFTVSALLLFTVSGLYNIRSWSPARELLLRRLDHANIFWFIRARTPRSPCSCWRAAPDPSSWSPSGPRPWRARPSR